jgi:hypothetical protein
MAGGASKGVRLESHGVSSVLCFEKKQMTDAERDRYMAKIANSAERLAALLRHQEPGLLSWASDVRRHAEIVANWWNGEKANPEPVDRCGDCGAVMPCVCRPT